MFLVGLVFLAIGAITFAAAIWHSDALPRWAAVIFAIGLALWFPPFPRVIRTLDGLLIGIGGIWLAWSLWWRHVGRPIARAANTSILR